MNQPITWKGKLATLSLKQSLEELESTSAMEDIIPFTGWVSDSTEQKSYSIPLPQLQDYQNLFGESRLEMQQSPITILQSESTESELKFIPISLQVETQNGPIMNLAISMEAVTLQPLMVQEHPALVEPEMDY